MQNKVLQFERIRVPDDLMTVREFALKHGCSREYLYKLKRIGKLKMYPRGYMKVSELEALEAMER